MGERSKALLIGVLVFAMACPGCGLLINGRKQKITINSDPADAKISIPSAGLQATTPAMLQLARKDDHMVIIEKEGYEKKTVILTSEIEPLALILDILLWGGLGLLVDWPLGAMHELSPDKVYVDLKKK